MNSYITTGKSWTLHTNRRASARNYSCDLAVFEALAGGFIVVWVSGCGWNDKWINRCKPVSRDVAAKEWRQALAEGFKVDKKPRYTNVEKDYCSRVSVTR